MVANRVLLHLNKRYIHFILRVKGDLYEYFTNISGWNHNP